MLTRLFNMVTKNNISHLFQRRITNTSKFKNLWNIKHRLLIGSGIFGGATVLAEAEDCPPCEETERMLRSMGPPPEDDPKWKCIISMLQCIHSAVKLLEKDKKEDKKEDKESEFEQLCQDVCDIAQIAAIVKKYEDEFPGELLDREKLLLEIAMELIDQETPKELKIITKMLMDKELTYVDILNMMRELIKKQLPENVKKVIDSLEICSQAFIACKDYL